MDEARRRTGHPWRRPSRVARRKDLLFPDALGHIEKHPRRHRARERDRVAAGRQRDVAFRPQRVRFNEELALEDDELESDLPFPRGRAILRADPRGPPRSLLLHRRPIPSHSPAGRERGDERTRCEQNHPPRRPPRARGRLRAHGTSVRASVGECASGQGTQWATPYHATAFHVVHWSAWRDRKGSTERGQPSVDLGRVPDIKSGGRRRWWETCSMNLPEIEYTRSGE